MAGIGGMKVVCGGMSRERAAASPAWMGMMGDDSPGCLRRRQRRLRLVALQYAKCDAKQDMKSVEEQDVPHAEQRLRQISLKSWGEQAGARTSTGRQSVKRERNHEKHIAGRSMPSSARCAASFGMLSWTDRSRSEHTAHDGTCSEHHVRNVRVKTERTRTRSKSAQTTGASLDGQ